MVKHIVMWNINNGLNKDEVVSNLKEKLEKLVGQIDGLQKLEIGVNYNESEASYDVVLYSEFTSKKALEDYSIHPSHLEAGKYIKTVLKDRIYVDYEV